MADEEVKPAKAKGGKKKLFLILGVLVVVLCGGGAGFLLTDGFGLLASAAETAHDDGGDDHTAAADDHGSGHGDKGGHAAPAPRSHGGEHGDEVQFVTITELLVNLRSDGNRPRFLKLVVAFEIADENAAAALEKFTPRIVDSFQIYLRSLSTEDLNEPSSVFRLKENLIARTNSAIAPAMVSDVLVKEMLVQ